MHGCRVMPTLKTRGCVFTSSFRQTTVRKEMRSIPSLIFAMEQLEKFLIQLSKKSKVWIKYMHILVWVSM